MRIQRVITGLLIVVASVSVLLSTLPFSSEEAELSQHQALRIELEASYWPEMSRASRSLQAEPFAPVAKRESNSAQAASLRRVRKDIERETRQWSRRLLLNESQQAELRDYLEDIHAMLFSLALEPEREFEHELPTRLEFMSKLLEPAQFEDYSEWRAERFAKHPVMQLLQAHFSLKTAELDSLARAFDEEKLLSRAAYPRTLQGNQLVEIDLAKERETTAELINYLAEHLGEHPHIERFLFEAEALLSEQI